MTPGDSVSTMRRFSTSDWPEEDRLAALQDVYARALIQCDVEPWGECPVHFEATVQSLPGVEILSGASSGFRIRRGASQIDPDHLLLNINLAGARDVRQRGREATYGEGEAILIAGQPGETIIQPCSRFVTLKMPRKSIAPLVADLDAHLVRAIPRETEALRLLSGYLGTVRESGPAASPDLQRLVATQLTDLAALALGATRDAGEVARMRSIGAARLRAIKAGITGDLAADHSAGALAARHGVTPRYIHMLFESEGTTASEFVIEQRLARAHRMLGDPRFAHRTIAAMAYDVGFGDVSYFNRAFRRRFGHTPTAARKGR